MLSAELHCHSELSFDGRDPIELLLSQADAVGLDALAVTDHDEIDASLAAADRAADYGLIGIPGSEVTSAAGHVLALGIHERVSAGLPFTETIERIHDQGGIAVVPHPFQRSRSGVAPHITSEELASADAIEIYNSRLLTGRSNRRAGRFARSHDLPMTAGSDAHIAEMVGQAVTHVDATDHTAAGVLDGIRNGHTEITGKRTPWYISFRQAAGGVKRRIKNMTHNIMQM
ncbi:PHP domain-containing protein [Halococcus qingdaonensis]|uniref:PHP domain-containing protein n=1 Tax=Halococcus qingdaonensis TaxID=224402 RepID=UPI002116728B|nr:PHP domain-containing protein [Halococcus qingdaonensis]